MIRIFMLTTCFLLGPLCISCDKYPIEEAEERFIENVQYMTEREALSHFECESAAYNPYMNMNMAAMYGGVCQPTPPSTTTAAATHKRILVPFFIFT